MTGQSPPLSSEEAVVDTPKKVWSKPCILRIEDGALKTQSGTNPDPSLENSVYHPTS